MALLEHCPFALLTFINPVLVSFQAPFHPHTDVSEGDPTIAMRGEVVGLPLERSLSEQVQDGHLPSQQDTPKLSLEIYLHDEYQFSR